MKKTLALFGLFAIAIIFIPNYGGGIFCNTTTVTCFKSASQSRPVMPL